MGTHHAVDRLFAAKWGALHNGTAPRIDPPSLARMSMLMSYNANVCNGRTLPHARMEVQQRTSEGRSREYGDLASDVFFDPFLTQRSPLRDPLGSWLKPPPSTGAV